MEIKDLCILDTGTALAFRKPLLAGTEISFQIELCRIGSLFFPPLNLNTTGVSPFLTSPCASLPPPMQCVGGTQAATGQVLISCCQSAQINAYF